MSTNTLKVELAHASALKTAIKRMTEDLDISDLIEIGEFISKQLDLEVEDRW
jgi:hypothetical protein